MTDLSQTRLLLYLGGLAVRPPPPPLSLRVVAINAMQGGKRDPSALFGALVREARGLIPENLSSNLDARGRLAHRWAAEITRALFDEGHLTGDVGGVASHLTDEANPRAAVMGLLSAAPNLSTHALAEMTGASPMTVGRARKELAGEAE